jgi:hypothetical protein
MLCVLTCTAMLFLSAAQAKDGALVIVGTVWKDKVTQKDEYKGQAGAPLDFDFALTITKCDGQKSRPIVREDRRHEGNVPRSLAREPAGEGQAREELQSGVGIGRGEGRGQHRGDHEHSVYRRSRGKKLKAARKYSANVDGTNLEVTFEFELTKKE